MSELIALRVTSICLVALGICALGQVRSSSVGASAPAASALTKGVLQGAEFQTGLPTSWNGGLVMFAHGYQGEGTAPGQAGAPPIAAYLTEHGYAWAASGYRARGYHPDWFLEDTLALRERFISEFGAPRWTILYGQSMGGHIAIEALERRPGAFQGGLVECGNLEGAGFMNWVYAYTAAAEYASGLPLLDTPRPAFDAMVKAKWRDLMGTPGHPTRRGATFASIVRHLNGGVAPSRLEEYLMNLNPRDPGPLRSQEFARHADTRHIRYDIDPGYGLDAATLNREVRRVLPEPANGSLEASSAYAEVTGKIGVPLVTLHNLEDFTVPIRMEQDYLRRARAAGTAHFLVQRVAPKGAHCTFDRGTRERAFDDLVDWMEHGSRPSGDDVLNERALVASAPSSNANGVGQ